MSSYRTRHRLTHDSLGAACSALRNDVAISRQVRFFANSSLYPVGLGWRFVRPRGSTWQTVTVLRDRYIGAIVRAARKGRTRSELTTIIMRRAPDLDREQADEYVGSLIENSLLVQEIEPCLTGSEPVATLIRQLEALPAAGCYAAVLRSAAARLRALDASPISAPLGSDYCDVTADLRRISAVVDERPTVCADLFKPLEAGCLPGTIIQELKQSVALLCRISPTKPDAELRDFCARFEDRYGQGWVGLCEALDPDLGVGFPAQGGNAPAPTKPADSQMAQEAGSSFHGEILRRAVSRAGVALEVALAPGDFPLGGDAGLVLPQSFAVLAAIDADSAASVRSGRYSVYLKGGVGPSGARLIARFCSGDDQLTASLATLLQRERDAEPDAVFADVVCCPEPGVGNVLWRPSLYQYEIPYLGRPGSTPDRHLHIGDLLVSVRRGEAILYSRRLQRRVIPRLATAHNFAKATLPTIYRFLSLLQAQSGRYVPSLNWGQFAKLPFLPRVRFGHVILSLAQWIIPAGDVSDAWRETGAARFAAVQRARSRLGLPRWVVAGEGDQLMAVDLNNALSVDAFVQGAKPGACLRVRELYPDRPLVTGPEGRFYHELVIPMRYQPGGERGSRTLGRPAAMNPAGRRFLPGSEWLYLKIYGGADALRCFLRARLPPLIQTLTRQGLLNNWFFVRYGDPWNHLRLRLEATSREAAKTVHALGLDAISGKLGGGNIWRIQLDTYEREIERYGGAEGIIAAEALFCA